MGQRFESSAQLDGPRYRTTVMVRHHMVDTDEPSAAGGEDTGPTPVELLMGSLASCTAMTVKMYAQRKEWGLKSVGVTAVGEREGEGPGALERVRVSLALEGELTDEQRERLKQVAGACPVKKTLAAGVEIETELV